MPRVYDCVVFNNELDLLDIRLRELWEVVDVFVICESRFDWSGWRKPLYYRDNAARFAQYAEKVRLISLDEGAPVRSPLPPRKATIDNEWEPVYWANEFFQKNEIKRGWHDAADDDLILISDADEIPSPLEIQRIPVDMMRRVFCEVWFNYNFNLIDPQWGGGNTAALRFGRIKADNLTVIECRDLNIEHSWAIPFGGWHCNFFGGRQAIVAKEQTYPHPISTYTERAERGNPLDHGVRGGKNIFLGRTDHLPRAVQADLPRYVHHFDHRFVNANSRLFTQP